jgi:hypothetical protein
MFHSKFLLLILISSFITLKTSGFENRLTCRSIFQNNENYLECSDNKIYKIVETRPSSENETNVSDRSRDDIKDGRINPTPSNDRGSAQQQ